VKHLHLLAVGTALLLPLGIVQGNTLDPEAWPRTYQLPEAEIAIYMPQILEWQQYLHLKANAVIGVKLKGSKEASFGTVTLDADTVTDFDDDCVRLGHRNVSNFRFPELDASQAGKAEELVRSILRPESPLEMPLESVTAALERSDTAAGTAVNFEPPPIFVSDAPAVLVTFIGPPRFEPVAADPSLMFAVNTNWDVLTDGSQYFLLAGNRWLMASDPLKGPWTPATSLPASFQTLPDDGNWSEVRAKLYILPETGAPLRVFTSERPAEIVVTEGKPQLAAIPKTSLMVATNTENDLFYHPAGKSWYLLLSGRWFSSPSLDGPWKAAGETLPQDFQEIPADHPKADVLVSVKGTPEAQEAVILASIPQTATAQRNGTAIRVTYGGEPQFKAVPGAPGVEFAYNTDSDVFRIAGVYYCCHQGIWFQAATARGKWIVCDKLPDAVYTIPPESPKYHVTHVHVYESDADTVKVGVTSGYYGAYVARGVVVFGLGMWLGHELAEDDYWHPHYQPVPLWYGYGCGAVYHPGCGYYRRAAWYYGPYGGAGYGAGYNPATGRYVRGAYAYGPYRSAGIRAAYNPWTDTAAGRVSASTPYGSWGRSVVVRDDEWIRAGHRSTASGTIAGVQSSRGGVAVGVDRTFGPDGFLGKTADGDIYVGKDGNFYRRDEDGDWHKREKGGWQDVPEMKPDKPRPETLPAPKPSQRPAVPEKSAARPDPAKPRQADAKSGSSRETTSSQLERDAYSRRRAGGDRRSPRR